MDRALNEETVPTYLDARKVYAFETLRQLNRVDVEKLEVALDCFKTMMKHGYGCSHM